MSATKLLLFVLTRCTLISTAAYVSVYCTPAHADQTHAIGPNLGVTIIRSGHDPRALMTVGGTVTLSIGVNNLRGDADAHACVLVVKLVDGLKVKQARPVPIKTEHGNGSFEMTWDLGTLAARAFPRIFELDLTTAREMQSDTRLPVLAKVTTGDNDVEQENNSSTFALRVAPALAALTLESNLEGSALTLGSPVSFIAEITNWGTVSAAATVLKLILPPKVSFQSGDPTPSATPANILTWQLGDIEPADSRKVEIAITLDTSVAAEIGNRAPESLLKFTFDASTTTPQINQSNNHLEIDKRVELAGFDLQTSLGLEGTEPGRLPVGKDVTYAITYGNFGNTTASKAAVSLSLGDGLRFVGADPSPTRSGKSDRFGGGVLTWDVGDLNVGQSDLIKCRVHVTSVPYYGSLVMSNIAAAGTDINPANNSAFFYGYPPTIAGAQSGLSNADGNRNKGFFGVIWPFLTIAVIVGIWFALRRIRRHGTSQ